MNVDEFALRDHNEPGAGGRFRAKILRMTTLAHTFHGPQHGSGVPVLVLLHAYPLDSRMWDEVITYLRERDPDLPILTLDAPGFGGSPSGEELAEALGEPDSPSLETFAHAIEATLESAGVEDIVLAGLSLGGYAALAHIERYRSRLRGLALLDTKAEADEEPARKVRLATAVKVLEQGTSAIEGSVNMVLGQTTLATKPGVVAAMREQILAAPPAAVAWIQRAMAARPDRLHVLKNLVVPTLVLRGEEDALSGPEAARVMAEAAGVMAEDVMLVTIPEVGHMSANEAPEAVATALANLYSAAHR